jgi:hypothetical protein
MSESVAICSTRQNSLKLRVTFINRVSTPPVARIISGGQTGVDRAALDAARAAGIATGGYVPSGRSAEDGTIAYRYKNLVETSSGDPAVRTILNVINSDATLIISRGTLRGGSLLTRSAAHAEKRPWLHADLLTMTRRSAARLIQRWLARVECETLNVAGPRRSEDPEIYCKAAKLLKLVLQNRQRGHVRPRRFTNKQRSITDSSVR